MNRKMFKASKVVFALLIVALLVNWSCASGGTAPARSPLETAKLTYADASIAYEATMQTIVDARRAHLVNDAQWARADQAQALVRQYAPIVRSGIDLWSSSGTKPSSIDEALAKLSGATSEINAVKAEVKP